jgi:ribosome-binding factor A
MDGVDYDRTDRIAEEVRRELDKILREQVRDPRVSGTFSLTRVEVTRDLRYARVRVSVLEAEKRQPLLKALKGCAGYARRLLGQSLSLRYTPELLFELDTNIEYGAHIASLLQEILPAHTAEAGSESNGAD